MLAEEKLILALQVLSNKAGQKILANLKTNKLLQWTGQPNSQQHVVGKLTAGAP